MDVRYDWQYQPAPSSTEIQALSQELAVSPLVATLLLERGINSADAWDRFAHPDMAALHDPFALHDMQKAIDRIQQAVAENQKITIYGDYDVDGLTSATIMLEALQSVGAEPDVYIPNRFTDGYGPNAEVYRYLQKSGTQLVITVDNGIAGAEVIDEAMANGMDVIVTDHHELPQILPQAVAVVHPRYPGSDYPFGDLSGAGVAFKVATALLGEVPIESVDLAALGAVADLVSLTDENRILVQLGLQLIHQQPRLGISALLEVADVKPEAVNETTIGFVIGPRLNALGRLGDAGEGVDLLTTFDETEAEVLAKKINTINEERQKLVQQITIEALAMAQSPDRANDQTLLLAHEGWHEGVLGIVASRIVETTGKPTVVMRIEGDQAKGSGRSVPAYHLFNSVDAVRDLTTHFGGHHMAIGLTAPVANLDAIHAAMEKAAVISLAETPKPPLTIAGRLEQQDLTLANYEALRALAPFGSGNPQPVFELKPKAISDVRTMGKDGSHLRFKTDGISVVGFGFGAAQAEMTAATQMKLAVLLEENVWQGRTSLQLRLKDVKVPSVPIKDLRLPKPSGEQFRASSTYLFFNEKKMQQLTHQYTFGGPTQLVSQQQAPVENAVLVDLPTDEASLKQALNVTTWPIGVIFSSTPAELVGMPTRTEFGQVLRFLQQQPHFDKHHLPQIATATHLAVSQVILIIQVFFELNFVTIDGAFISPVENPAKQALESASAYSNRQAFLNLAHQLQTLPTRELLHYLQTLEGLEG
ncbi:single-stranded-DNA-specific exonuclease RecJ [Lacticaseibacillus brantae]|uniref:single-stranded-DNA-specific exonuclease RecJ n=1 Tax=Lacticaseibacillus brantae TaxID=943673 RepID=UPI000A9E449E|nr:single-stranded-DNA-specific exonuclease RecJ [Lacticaseibacillus brantae]